MGPNQGEGLVFDQSATEGLYRAQHGERRDEVRDRPGRLPGNGFHLHGDPGGVGHASLENGEGAVAIERCVRS